MGLILGPLIIFWIVVAVFSLKMGYSLLTEFTLFPSFIIIVLIAILSLSSYVYFGLQSFKDSSELWWADIPIFFTTNKYAMIAFVAALLVHWFGADYLKHEYIKPAIFIVVFSVSFGALAGTFSSESFMEKHKIAPTH